MSVQSFERLVGKMNNKMWIPLVASIGVGAATYYAVSKNSNNFNSAIQQVLPIVSQMTKTP